MADLEEVDGAIRIQLLGGFHITVGAIPVAESAWRLQKARGLVKLLALAPGRRLHREQVMELLWPDLEHEAAANNLYYALHIARRALVPDGAGPSTATVLRLRQQMLALEPAAPLWIDIEAFEQAADIASHADDTAAYAAAIALYTGDLLPEDRYEDWSAGRREALRIRYLDLLLGLARRHEADGAYPEAIAALQRVVATDAADEEAHAGLMRLYALTGQRQQALRQYAVLVEALRRELDAEPDPRTRRLHADIEAGRIAPIAAARALSQPAAAPAPDGQTLADARGGAPEAAHAQTSGPAAPSPRRAAIPLVGRRQELKRLQREWQLAAHSPRLALLSGEAGIGKTRLAEALLARAAHEGIATAVARCYASEGDLAYAPVAAWLRADALFPPVLTLDDVWLSEVARLVPEVLVERPDLPAPGPLTEDWQRRRVFEALARAMGASGRPLLLLLDDAPWCDQETLAWLHFLLRMPRAPHVPLLVVATARSEAVDGSPALVALLADLRREGRHGEVELPPLDGAETATLAEALAGRKLVAAESDRLYAETEGNPLFIVGIVRAGLLNRWQEPPGDAHGAAATPAEADTLPSTIQSVIAARLAQLSAEAHALAGAAAVIGREFSIDVLVQAGRGDEEAILRGLDELWQRRIVRAKSADSYDFSHDKLREAAYRELSTARRRSLHRRVAVALEAVHAGALDPVSGQIARHFERAGLLDRAIPYYERAGDWAQGLFANAEAEGFCRRLLELLEMSGRTGEAAVAREKLSTTLSLMARYDEAAALLESAVGYYRQADDLEGIVRASARLGRIHALRGTPGEGIALLQKLLEALDSRVLSARGQADLYAALAYLYNNSGRYLDALSASEHAAECARLARDTRLLVQVERLRGLALMNLDRPAEAIEVLEAIIPEVEALGDLSTLCYAHNNVSLAYIACGDLKTSHLHAERALECAQRVGGATTLAFMLQCRGQIEYTLGEWDQARADYEQAMAQIRSVGMSWAAAHPLLGLGTLRLAQGRWEEATHLLEECIATAERIGNPYTVPYAVSVLVERDLVRGEPQLALERLAPFVARCEAQEGDVAVMVPLLAWARLETGAVEEAARLIAPRLAIPDHPLDRWDALCTGARVAMRQERWAEAQAALDESLALTRALPCPCGEAIALYVYGLLHIAQGEPELARHRLESALAIQNRLGERLYAEQVERALVALGARIAH